jgi:DNA-binding CsgD family transcriptional regulator
VRNAKDPGEDSRVDTATAFAIDPRFLPADDWDEIRRTLRLSVREADIAALIIANASNGTIAQRLSISAHTVHSHLERLYRKLAICSREELITCVFRTYVQRHSMGERDDC